MVGAGRVNLRLLHFVILTVAGRCHGWRLARLGTIKVPLPAPRSRPSHGRHGPIHPPAPQPNLPEPETRIPALSRQNTAEDKSFLLKSAFTVRYHCRGSASQAVSQRSRLIS